MPLGSLCSPSGALDSAVEGHDHFSFGKPLTSPSWFTHNHCQDIEPTNIETYLVL